MCFSYADDYELDLEQKDALWFFINRMDTAFREWWVKKQPKPRAPKGKGIGRTRGIRQKDGEEG